MENQQSQMENEELINWHRPEVRILTINKETSIVQNGSTPPLVDQE